MYGSYRTCVCTSLQEELHWEYAAAVTGVLKLRKLWRLLVSVLGIRVKTEQVEEIAPKLELKEYSEYSAEY